jgi:hypothetical protein
MHQCRIARRRCDEQARRLEEPPAARDRPQPLLGGRDLGRVAALRGAEDAVADAELGRGAARELGRRGEHDAGELGPGHPGQRRLVLVLAADLQQVEEVGRRGADGNEIFRGRGGGVREADHFEVLWPLGINMIRLCLSLFLELLEREFYRHI